MTNAEMAGTLRRVAELLEQGDENPYRVQSYRRAAETVEQAGRSLAEVYREEGQEGLESYSGIGERLAGTLRELIETRRLGLLDRLEAEVSPASLLARVPGVGETLAERIHEELGVGTLEALERAAHDGRLEAVEGIGAEKAEGIRDALAGMLSRAARRRARERSAAEREGADERASAPSVAAILEIDEEYRRKAAEGELRTIAPKRFNPEGKRWLPVLETERDGWRFTALYSNTAKAHERGKTGDWVVVYWEKDGADGQNTVITAESGPRAGQRIVPGR
jgi:DNA polymerase/3'-5' exonuclease PolX